MGKKSTRRAAVTTSSTAAPLPPPGAAQGPSAAGEVPVVGGREPCPCGSGRRYKACHGRAAATAADQLVRRPFQGLASECDWVALREIVPAATSPLTLRAEGPAAEALASAGDVPAVTLSTVLPLAWPGLRRADGTVLLGLQLPGGGGDVSRDLADAVLRALATEPGNPVPPVGLPGAGPRLQDLLDPDAPLRVTVHPGFDYWLEGSDDQMSPEVAASLERANAAVVPTERLVSVEGAYWAQVRDKVHLRWVLPYDEEPLLDAMARLHAAGADTLGAGSRFIGSFRAHGLLVPVWDLAPGTTAEGVEDEASDYLTRLQDALADDTPLSAQARGARSGLLNRQLTLR